MKTSTVAIVGGLGLLVAYLFLTNKQDITPSGGGGSAGTTNNWFSMGGGGGTTGGQNGNTANTGVNPYNPASTLPSIPGSTATLCGPGGCNVINTAAGQLAIPSTVSPISQWGLQNLLANNPYAPGYIQTVANQDWQATTYDIAGKSVSGVQMVIPQNVASQLNPAFIGTTAGGQPATVVTGVTSQGIVQTAAGDFYSTGAKAGQPFTCSKWVQQGDQMVRTQVPC